MYIKQQHVMKSNKIQFIYVDLNLNWIEHRRNFITNIIKLVEYKIVVATYYLWSVFNEWNSQFWKEFCIKKKKKFNLGENEYVHLIKGVRKLIYK